MVFSRYIICPQVGLQDRMITLFLFFKKLRTVLHGNPSWHIGKESACSAGDMCLISGSGRSHGEGNGNPFLPKKSDGQKSLAGYSPRGHQSWTWLGNETTTTTAALLLQEFAFPPTVQDGSFLSCVAFLDGGFRDWSSLEVSVSSQSCWTIEEATARDRGNHSGWQALCFQPSANM